jgi:hypothetical protein
MRRSASRLGPHSCPSDQTIHVDLEFFRNLSSRFDAPGDFAQAFVLAHEARRSSGWNGSGPDSTPATRTYVIPSGTISERAGHPIDSDSPEIAVESRVNESELP